MLTPNGGLPWAARPPPLSDWHARVRIQTGSTLEGRPDVICAGCGQTQMHAYEYLEFARRCRRRAGLLLQLPWPQQIQLPHKKLLLQLLNLILLPLQLLLLQWQKPHLKLQA